MRDIQGNLELEMLLEKHNEKVETREYNDFDDMRFGVRDSERLKSDKGSSIFDLIKMIDFLVTKTLGDLNVEFVPDEGKVLFLESTLKLDRPMITYKVISRKHKGEKKPRVREEIREEGDTGRIGEVYGQKFQSIIQFNVFASVYQVAEEVMERFETMLLQYTGYLKRNGISEIIFNDQFTDDAYQIMRQTLSVRNFSYYVETEKLTVIMRESIKGIETY